MIALKYTYRIRALREDKDLTQAFVASLLNVGQKTYSDYELGKSRIPIDSMIKLAEFYNVSMDYICGITKIKAEYPRS
jgi:transcriptional regulator with XRE-family HTH domain